ncbi:AraC family transcriptional regulator [Amycolatopsis sp. YIM 10]|uniref:helix-turn-helix transcriptional regulator n=1 Tax=Amycolatopsis sp. YIM 10 TaxID=2653857 RepID=UPI0012A9A281|nr:AraC family transcriptional regulator [Amycolatopsis sp. YIM 10]QFU86840.1 Transcriptional activator NphR [Amycolatopsis sp. YIM 10]
MAAGGWVRYWRDGDRPVEAMHAHFFDHVYPPHSHDTYSFGITDVGAQRFSCRGGAHTSGAGMVMAFNPDEVHDGRAAAESGYQYRIVHLGPSVVREVITDATGRPGALPLFPRPVLDDAALAGALARLHAALAGNADPLVRDERLTAAVTAMARRGAATPPARPRTPTDRAHHQAAHRARALLDERYPAPIPATELAEAAGCSRFALYRAFHAEFGFAPSAYQRQLRLRHARSLLRSGATPADAASATGFADQAHLSRWFQRVYGVTPGAFRRAGSPIG